MFQGRVWEVTQPHIGSNKGVENEVSDLGFRVQGFGASRIKG